VSKNIFLEEIPRRGTLVEVTLKSTRPNHLDEKYTWVREFSKVTRILRNERGETTGIRLKGTLIKLVKISRRKKCLYTIIGSRRFILEMEIIPQE
jgi:hypothetical protein